MNPTLLDKAEEQTALVPAAEPSVETGLVSMFERLAANPDVPVEKLERLIAMQERIMAHNAKAQFDAAFAEMQGALPIIAERGTTNNGTYARLEDIIETVRPILQQHGFALSHTTEWPDAKTVRIIGILAHRAGHERRSEFLSAADASGNKNTIQGLGSALSYGRRYTTKDLLNIATRGEDDDARAAAGKPKPKAPEGFDDWLDNMRATADMGLATLEDVWRKSKNEYRLYLTKNDPVTWAKLKTKAGAVK